MLPTRNELLRACAGTASPAHPVARAAAELAALHRLRTSVDRHQHDDIDCARACSVRLIDRWTASNAPVPSGAAYLHTESVGMIIDRLAQFHVEAHAALLDSSETVRHYLWTRLAELSLAYTDLTVEIAAGVRKLPVAVVPPRGPG